MFKEVVQKVFADDPQSIRKERSDFLKKWMKRALELKESEEELHEGLPSHLKHLLVKKKLLLWKEILVDLQYPDAKVVDEICEGFALPGWVKSFRRL